MTRLPRYITLLCITAAIPLAAACGSAKPAQPLSKKPAHPLSKKQYERQLSSIQHQAFAKASPATLLLGAQGGNGAKGLLIVQQVAATEAHKLAKITPPTDISQPHRRLIAALRAYANDLGDRIRALRAHKLQSTAIPQKLRSLKSVRAIRAARAAIINHGYSIR